MAEVARGSGWALAEGGAVLGLATGPFAPIAAPVFAVAGGLAGGFGGIEMGEFVGEALSELDLPEPPSWADAGKHVLWAGLVVFVGMAYFVARGILAGLRGNYLTTVLVLGFSSFAILMMAPLLLAAAGKAQPRTSSDATGFTVWPDKRFSTLYLT